VVFVLVDEDHRRRRVATLLWKIAGDVAGSRGWPALRHSAERSLEGDLWARSVGGEFPDPVRPPRPYAEQIRNQWS
jgi:hypothetical protein